MSVSLRLGDALVILPSLTGIGAVVTDPPYGISLFGIDWDNPTEGNRAIARWGSGTPEQRMEFHRKSNLDYESFCFDWLSKAFGLLPSGGRVKVMSATKSFHRLVSAMARAGFVDIGLEAWSYSSGWPKSRNLSKDMDLEVPAAPGRKAVSKRERVETEDDHLARWHVQQGFRTKQGSLVRALEGTLTTTSDEPVSEEAKRFLGWGTALKPAWEPIVVGVRP